MVLKLQTADLERTYTAEEFEAAAEFEGRYELLEGKPVKKMPASNEHTRIAKRIQRGLTLFDPEEKLGEMLVEPSYKLTVDFMPEPDLAFTIATRVPPTTKQVSHVAPDLVIEILSPHALESQNRFAEAMDKIRKYQTIGRIALIWVINPSNYTVQVYQLEQEQPLKTLNVGDELDGGTIIPGFKLKIDALFGL